MRISCCVVLIIELKRRDVCTLNEAKIVSMGGINYTIFVGCWKRARTYLSTTTTETKRLDGKESLNVGTSVVAYDIIR